MAFRADSPATRRRSTLIAAIVLLVAVPLLILAASFIAFMSFDMAELVACPSSATGCTWSQDWMERTLIVLVCVFAVCTFMWSKPRFATVPRGASVLQGVDRGIRWLQRAAIVAPCAVLGISWFAGLVVHPMLCKIAPEMTGRVASCVDLSWGLILVVPLFLVFYGALLWGAIYLLRRFVIRPPI